MTGEEIKRRYVLQRILESGEPVRPPVFRTTDSITADLKLARSWPSMPDAIEAAPGPGWRVVTRGRIEEEMKA